MDQVVEFIRRKRKKETRYIYLRLSFYFTFSIPIFFSISWLFSPSSLILLILLSFTPTLIILIGWSLPYWKSYFTKKYGQADQFIEKLESKTSELDDLIDKLSPLPKEVYWIEFEIDPNSFKMKLNLHTTSSEIDLDQDGFQSKIEDLISTNESTIVELRNYGDDSREFLELMIETTQIWISERWNSVMGQDFKIRATSSISDRQGYFNMSNNRWEDTSIFSGYYLERLFKF